MKKRIITHLGFLSTLGLSTYSLYIRKETHLPTLTAPDSEIHFDLIGQAIWTKDGQPLNSPTRNKHSQRLLNSWRRVQPVRATWTTNKNNKETTPKKGRKATNLIRDYSFRFANDCLSGTLWILDYELPEDNTYPTKFFFGTNAHIVEDISLDQSNPYKQVLPKTQEKCLNSKSKIIRETNLQDRKPFHFIPDLWDVSEKGFEPLDEKYNVETWTDTKEPPYFYYETDNIKLVYVATNFAGIWRKPTPGTCQQQIKDYISDFAVIEVDFKTPEIAQKMTRDFHTKYHYQTGKRKHKAIDFFSKPLIERKTNREMYEESIDIFLAGYPKNGLKGQSIGSFNLGTRQSSKLTYISGPFMIKNKKKDEVIGHTNACYWNVPITSFGEKRLIMGVEIILDYEPTSEGSSGSLTTDGERNALGVKSRHWQTMSTISIFRSPAIKYEGKTIIPAYDLLEGIATNSKDRSYMDSIVASNKKTHLSEMRKWGTSQSEALKSPKERKTSKQIISRKKRKKKNRLDTTKNPSNSYNTN